MKRLSCAIAAAVAAATAAGATPASTALTSCRTSALVVWLDPMGRRGRRQHIRDAEVHQPVRTRLHPDRVSGGFAVDLRGRRLGSTASRDASPAAPVHLADGATASALLRVANAG